MSKQVGTNVLEAAEAIKNLNVFVCWHCVALLFYGVKNEENCSLVIHCPKCQTINSFKM